MKKEQNILAESLKILVIEELVKKFHNDMELGKEVRKFIKNHKNLKNKINEDFKY